MMPENIPESQDFASLFEEEKSILDKESSAKYKNYLKQLPNFAFDNNTVSSFGNFVFLIIMTWLMIPVIKGLRIKILYQMKVPAVNF